MSPRRRALSCAAAAGLVALCLGGCGDDDGADPEAAATTDPLPPDVGPVIATEPSADPEYLQRVTADGEVTAAELEAAYETYVQCLAEGGAYGRFAYDVSLRIPLTLEWRLDGDDGLGSAAASLDAGCSHDYLGDLAGRFAATHPQPDDLAARQRESIVDCIRPISPRAAAAVPASITTDTGAEGVYIGEAQLDVLAFDPELADDREAVAAIAECFATLGATWHEFGDPAATPTSLAPPSTS